MKFRFRPLVAGAAVAGFAIAASLWIRLGPLPAIGDDAFASMTIVDRNGVVLSEPMSLHGTRGERVGEADLPPLVVDATIAAEDRRFFSHHGIDPRAVVRAIVHDVRHLRIVEGGSTISQQVAKLILRGEDRGFVQKGREAVVAMRLEHHYSKRQILALYLSLAPYGQETVGIVRGSRRWFGVEPDNLTPAQAAFLAALPQHPSAGRAAKRQRVILARMRTLGFLDAATFATARTERLRLDVASRPLLAPHFVERVRQELGTAHPTRVVTTLDSGLQHDIEGIIDAQKRSLVAHGAHAVAVAVLDNRSGQWLAWEGSGDYFGGDRGESRGTSLGGAIDGVTTLRQPGSTLKPFTYALGFETGSSPATVLADVPSHFPTAVEGVVYTPRNYDGHFRGPMRARAALAGSENVPAVELLSRLGPPALLRMLRKFGFRDLTRTADYYGLGLTLGDAEVTLQQLVGAYSIFARGGVAIAPRMIMPAAGQHPAGERVLSPRTAFWITDILSDSRAREFIFGSGGSLDFPFPVAVKTGTSQAYHDNWCVGYTREVTVGVWVGNFDRDQLRNSSGVTGAGPIFHAAMLAAMNRFGSAKNGAEGPIVDVPPELEQAPICSLSGRRPSTECPGVETEWVDRSEPVQFCDWHHAGGRVDLPPEYRGWEGSLTMSPSQITTSAPGSAAHFRIISPTNGTTYLIDPTLHREFQAIHLRADAPDRVRVSWKLDGRDLGSSTASRGMEWSLAPGKHVITASTADGRMDHVEITVK